MLLLLLLLLRHRTCTHAPLVHIMEWVHMLLRQPISLSSFLLQSFNDSFMALAHTMLRQASCPSPAALVDNSDSARAKRRRKRREN